MARRYVDVIEAEAAIQDLFADMPRIEFMGNRRRWREENEQYLRCLEVLRSLPTADVVERKTGRWKDGHRSSWDGTRHWYRYCDRCDYERDDDDPVHDSYFCPNCGAEMEANDDRNG